MAHRKLESEVRDMKLKEEQEQHMSMDMDDIPVAQPVKEERSGYSSDDDTSTTPAVQRSAQKQSRSPTKSENMTRSPAVKAEEEVVGGDIELKLEPGKPPKLHRKPSQKIEKRPPQMFLDHEDSTMIATSTFSTLKECVYANKYLGTTEHALECDCAEEWGK